MAIDSLTQAAIPWRLAMNTPSLAGLWCGVRAGLGVTVRTMLAVPSGLVMVPPAEGLPALTAIDLVLHAEASRTAAVRRFRDLLQW